MAARATLIHILEEWNSTVSGSIISTLLLFASAAFGLTPDIVARFGKPGASFPVWPSFLATAITVLFVLISLWLSAFRVADRERMARIAAEEALVLERERSRPRLVGLVKLVGSIRDQETLGGRQAFFIYMSIRNDGFRSVAKDYHAVATVGGREIHGDLVETPDDFFAAGPDGKKKKFSEHSAIYNLTKKPIEPGDIRTGHLLVSFPDNVEKIPHEALAIRFRDYLESEFQTDRIEQRKIIGGMPHLDGLHTELE